MAGFWIIDATRWVCFGWSMKTFRSPVLTLAAWAATLTAAISGGPLLPGLERFYIGTQTTAGSVGIYQSSLNWDAGTFGPASLAATTTSPTFLAITRDRRFLYAVNESAHTVSAFSVQATTGALTFLNALPSNGNAPTHLTVDQTGRQVIVANYSGGSITMFPVLAGGQLGVANAHFQYAAGSRAHCATIDGANRFVFICDLGLNQIRSYVLDAAAGTLTPNAVPVISVAAGSGPRHLAFHPQNHRAYVICELNSTIIGFNYNATNGTLSAFQTKTTLPLGFVGSNSAAEIAVHPSGKFVYGSNRGHDSIAVFAVNPADGTLTAIQHQATGLTPRNFAIDPTGRYALVASQNSGTVVLYTIDPQTGALAPAGPSLAISKPVCIVPYITQPPQPDLAISAVDAARFRLDVSHTADVLTYEIYETPSLTQPAPWRLLTTGIPGQTSFTLNYTTPHQFFRVDVLKNY